jgi:tetratricopeptide (TPR) repeat protein
MVAAHTMVGILAEIEGDRASARAAYERALATDARAAVPANNLAWMLAESGQELDRALELAQVAKAGLPEVAAVDDTLGFAYYKKGLYPQAITAFQASSGREPQNAAFQLRLGLAYVKASRWQDGARALREALRLDPNVAGASEARKALETIGQS